MGADKMKSGYHANCGYPWAESADGKVRVGIQVRGSHDAEGEFVAVGHHDDEPHIRYLWPNVDGVGQAVRKLPTLLEVESFCETIVRGDAKPHPDGCLIRRQEGA